MKIKALENHVISHGIIKNTRPHTVYLIIVIIWAE